MIWVVCFFIGLVVGAFSMFLFVMDRWRRYKERDEAVSLEADRSRRAIQKLRDEQQDWSARRAAQASELRQKTEALERRIVKYDELVQENSTLKRDLQNVDVHLHKLQLDAEMQDQARQQLDQRSEQLAKRYLSETIKAMRTSLTPNNFTVCKARLIDVIGRCRDIGFHISDAEEAGYVDDLKTEFERVVKAAFEKEEQARIKAQIREEERLKREIDRELQQLERERLAIQAALDQALAEAKDQHSEEVQRLQARLAEAEERSQRAMSMAQQTKAGHVYIISNVGSFGEGVFKIGMTRRLEPNERVRELSDASVPFAFDVHMVISCDDAPTLENALHRALHKLRINRVNLRKEFFRTDIDTIYSIVKEHHGDVEYIVDPEALEYRQSVSMTEDDAEFIEQVYHGVDDEDEEQAPAIED